MEFVNIIRKQDGAVLELNRGKVNALNHQMVKEIRTAMAQLANDEQVRGVIITGKPHYFSAGLDLIELYNYSREEISAFWQDFLGMTVDLAKFQKPLIAAISGHSPAGGAVIAITCDYRIMVQSEKYLIGLNEVAVGINITDSIFQLYQFWLGKRYAYQSLLQGRLFSPAEAMKTGLVDQLVDLDDLMPEAELKLQSLLKANDYILRDTKKVMRRQLLKSIDVDMSETIKQRVDYWMSDEARAQLKAFVTNLTTRK
ncbi:MAG: enoyl-CoA hydratase/isomerase family protein [Saprospiraceae bacterium]|nr:enoyl-CoA hydratase/isomerase family protein [Saprospiraceae bacterium]